MAVSSLRVLKTMSLVVMGLWRYITAVATDTMCHFLRLSESSAESFAVINGVVKVQCSGKAQYPNLALVIPDRVIVVPAATKFP